MGLLDCVSDQSKKHEVAGLEERPLQRGMSQRRSMGSRSLFSSNLSLKGKDIDFWRHRLLCFLFRAEGREDASTTRIPLRKLGYTNIVDFIRDIPQDLYSEYQNQNYPDISLQKDYKVIWERGSIAEPGIVKWQGTIDGHRCMGLQLDRKKAVPFGTHDGKGLFYCKPGHRALVPIEEVHPYKQFLRQYIGMPPKKDSLTLNLLPGRSSKRIAVTKKYNPGDRVHLPKEGKWATILWTGKIDGQWVVDLVYDPEHSSKGRTGTPDEPCLSKSLSMAEFVNEVGLEPETPTDSRPPSHVPPPPPKTPPHSMELENDVFIDDANHALKSDSQIRKSSFVSSHDSNSEVDSASEASEDEDNSSVSSAGAHMRHENQVPAVERRRVSSDSASHGALVGATKPKASALEAFEMPNTLKTKPAHKPMFNLSFGRKKKVGATAESSIKSKVKTQEKPSSTGHRDYDFFKLRRQNKDADPKNDSTMDAEQSKRIYAQKDETNNREQRSRSPVTRKSGTNVQEISQQLTSEENSEAATTGSHEVVASQSGKSSKENDETNYMKSEEDSSSQDDSDNQSDSPLHPRIVSQHHKQRSQQETEKSRREYSSDSTPPYSPVVKDVGLSIQGSKRVTDRKEKASKSIGAFFALRKKQLPPKDYQEQTPVPPKRHESLEPRESNESSHKVAQMQTGHSQDSPGPSASPRKKQSPEISGDQDGLILETLEVKDDTNQDPYVTLPTQASYTQKPTSAFSFGNLSRKNKSPKYVTNMGFQADEGEFSNIVTSSPTKIGTEKPEVRRSNASPKKSSFRESFSRTFSFSKRKDSLENQENHEKKPRQVSTYIDNNEAIGAKNLHRSRPKSTSALVDIQPWDERRGFKKDIFEDDDNGIEGKSNEAGESNKSPSHASGQLPAALMPKNTNSDIPRHRIFTTPSFFSFGQKHDNQKSQVTSPTSKASSGFVNLKDDTGEGKKLESTTAVSYYNPSVTQAEENAETSPKHLKSALKQRKEIQFIPDGIKLGDRVIWYNGRVPIPGVVVKLYKDGTDKYSSVVKFDRPPSSGSEPLLLSREGDCYEITVEELITPKIFEAAGSSSSAENKIESLETSVPEQTPEKKPASVHFVPSSKPNAQKIQIDLASPTSTMAAPVPEEPLPPPLQEEEVELACGAQRGIEKHSNSACIETLLFSLFYTSNTFDLTMLYGNNGGRDENSEKCRLLLRQRVAYALRQAGYCDSSVIAALEDLLRKASPECNLNSADAEIIMVSLFDRALRLGKFISYSTSMTDYIHQLALNPKDHSKSGVLQNLLETSFELMDNCKLKSTPTPALIIEIPRDKTKLVQYEAIIPNLTLNLSALMENGPRLCMCGMVATLECRKCSETYDTALVYCETCKSTVEQMHFNLTHDAVMAPLDQVSIQMDLIAVLCRKDFKYTAFVKCGQERKSPWLYYDSNQEQPTVSLEMHLGPWVDRIEKFPGRYTEAFIHPLLAHFLANSHIFIYQPREKSSLV